MARGEAGRDGDRERERGGSHGARQHDLDEEVEVPLLPAQALPLVAACSLHADP